MPLLLATSPPPTMTLATPLSKLDKSTLRTLARFRDLLPLVTCARIAFCFRGFKSRLVASLSKSLQDKSCEQGRNLGLKIGGGELILPNKRAWLKMPRPH